MPSKFGIRVFRVLFLGSAWCGAGSGCRYIDHQVSLYYFNQYIHSTMYGHGPRRRFDEVTSILVILTVSMTHSPRQMRKDRDMRANCQDPL